VRGLIWIFGLFAAAVGLVLAARSNNGYVLLVLPPWRAELSLNLAILIAVLSIVAAYLVMRAIMISFAMPGQVRAYLKRRKANRARATFNDALVSFFEGRFGKAEKAAAAALKAGESPALSAILAARAAHGMRAFSTRDGYLAKAAAHDPVDDSMRLLAHTEMLLDERRYHDALDVLKRLPESHTAALRLELRAQQMAKNWDRVLALIPQLEKRKVFERPVVSQLRRHAIIENLKLKALDGKALREYWDRLPVQDRHEPRIAAAAVRCFIDLGACQEAHRVVADGVERIWDQGLLALYSECLGEDVRQQLERAEKWLQAHPRDAVLLLTLGRLCAHQGLWGKAHSYLEASLSIEPTHSAYLELARLMEREGKLEQAASHYQKALEVTLGQLKHYGGGRRQPVL